jgi:BCD family chlorophyll transporter-like MFS transporter
MGGIIRDVGRSIILSDAWPPVTNGYILVYLLEMILLAAALIMMVPLLRRPMAVAGVAPRA